jgi:ribosomal protein S18 acetylase RimI-like enzyme
VTAPSFRAASPVDRDAVVAFWTAEGLTRPWNPPAEDFAQFCDAPHAALLLAEDPRGIAATVAVGEDGHRAWAYYVAARSDLRGRGWGRAAMRAAEAWAASRGLPKLQLMVRESNSTVLGFYGHLGYRDSAVRVMERWLDPDRVRLAQANADAR